MRLVTICIAAGLVGCGSVEGSDPSSVTSSDAAMPSLDSGLARGNDVSSEGSGNASGPLPEASGTPADAKAKEGGAASDGGSVPADGDVTAGDAGASSTNLERIPTSGIEPAKKISSLTHEDFRAICSYIKRLADAGTCLNADDCIEHMDIPDCEGTAGDWEKCLLTGAKTGTCDGIGVEACQRFASCFR